MVNAYAAHEIGGILKPFQYQLPPIGAYEVDIQVQHCGICHSDLSLLENAWGVTQYPFVPGHEIVGTVLAVGQDVVHLKKGDRVGLGWHSAYCLHCDQCLTGNHNMCYSAQATIVGRHGGFADIVRAKVPSVVKLPDSVDMRTAGPLLCGGITVFNPLIQFNILPTAKVGVIGIGGLGHIAVQILRAWGCEVTAFTSSESKIEEALKMGANKTLNSRDSEELKSAENSFDLILSTVNVELDWSTYLSLLKPKGRLHLLGVVLEPLNLSVSSLLSRQKSVSASPVGSPNAIAQMLEFCQRHNIKPITQHFPLKEVNEAMEHLRAGKARYRVVLDMN
ncbi:NADPH-dependent aldehyde reductase Ahr [Cyanobacterium sp. Dongsha4]|uniref:NADPH-dependent aldehyde reductase Ahr n=1 Tax=Cyanobacterium sp. DS4 TaxID=2878255 RepID=UPI002E81C6B3|nr:NAD(P)-dependent alcohol dehydrogenase [Cyanobacterium sp. Dongsha4]WVL02400.1 NAD(P)-dependent alcohol dehydrogenase [Cyanobacterium sp. Dongsha4]